jgi:hypothetical protein
MLKTVSTQLALASDTLPEVLAKGNTTGGTDLSVSAGDDITFADNSKAIFGAGSDLSIYSDGTTGQVTGNVKVTGNVGVGVALSASALPMIEVGNAGNSFVGRGPADTRILSGLYFDTSGTYKYTQSGVPVGQYNIVNGGHAWSTAPSGSVGAAASPATTMYLDTSGQLSVPAGVLLGGTAAANLLDDYEEGAWTPNQGAGLTVVGAFSSNGTYTKIGRSVTVTGNVSGATSIAGSSGGVICTNLPFSGLGAAAGSVGVGNVNQGSTLISFATTIYLATAISAAAGITFTVTYEV